MTERLLHLIPIRQVKLLKWPICYILSVSVLIRQIWFNRCVKSVIQILDHLHFYLMRMKRISPVYVGTKAFDSRYPLSRLQLRTSQISSGYKRNIWIRLFPSGSQFKYSCYSLFTRLTVENDVTAATAVWDSLRVDVVTAVSGYAMRGGRKG